MAEANDIAGIIYQNLVDAGCDQKTTHKCMSMVKKGDCLEMLSILSQHRISLLDMVRCGQKQIDCLDYLIYQINENNLQEELQMNEHLNLVQDWDKTFPKSEKVNHCKITFRNRYGITLAADLYEPKNVQGRLPAIAVCGPFGAVKEQAAGLYAQTMAELGFLTIAFDPSFTGESGGTPRYVASPDINTEDFQAAVDFLSLRKNVDPNKIGIIGICGWGGMAINAAAIDTRIKATVASTMYDMTRVNAKGYFDAEDSEEARYEKRKALNAQRIEDYKNDKYALSGGVADVLPQDAPFYVKDYYDYYKTARGYHVRSLNSNGGWNITSALSFLNMPIMQYSKEIRSAVLVVHGEKAHSCYFGLDAFAKLEGENKELLIIPGAVHTDLYDQTDIIPFDQMEVFFSTAFSASGSDGREARA